MPKAPMQILQTCQAESCGLEITPYFLSAASCSAKNGSTFELSRSSIRLT
jgi:hypothetical protein